MFEVAEQTDARWAAGACAPVRPHLIAEAGTNHNGSVETGKRLIDAAIAAGAGSVKFQMIFPEGLYLPRFWQDGRYVESEVFAKRAATQLSDAQWRELAACARERGIPMSASVFDVRGLDLLDAIDAPYIKIASCDLNNGPLLREAARRGRRIILSTGMSSLEEIETAVSQVQSVAEVELVLMHCPCPTERMNLGFLDVLRETFGLPIGLSDHTESSLAAAIAVSKGVSWIEKHVTLDRSSEGFDHAYAMEPGMLAAYAQDIDAAWRACRPSVEKVSEQEATVRTRARRALYAARDIAPGERITEADVLIVRPEGSMPPNAIGQVVGAQARTAIRQYQAIAPELLG
jgi:N,N'-diacetyllegionaminate synthase